RRAMARIAACWRWRAASKPRWRNAHVRLLHTRFCAPFRRSERCSRTRWQYARVREQRSLLRKLRATLSAFTLIAFPMSASPLTTAAPADQPARPDPDRRSIRAYTSQAVPDDLLVQLLQAARQAPSGANLQPGRFLAVRGAARERLSRALIQARRQGQPEIEDYAYFPRPMPTVLKRRQIASAQALYTALGVERHDRTGRVAQFERNYRFFDAPVALVVTIDRRFGPGGYMDLGMSLYGLMLAARRHGLDTCAIGALASYPGVV